MSVIHSSQPSALVLRADTAEDLMTRNPLSIRDDATLESAAAFLIEKEISAAPVIDNAGRAVGVLSHTDIVRHDSLVGARRAEEAGFYREFDFRCPPALREFRYAKKAKAVRARDVMSPVVIQVSTDDPALTVIARLLALKIHRLFVLDKAETLVGVISTFDVLRCLHRD
jgi:CBS-domain-containing membrane protein